MTDLLRAYRWLITGRVQGVGFRWYTMRRAGECGAVGWVRNLPDGRVEVQAKGREDSLLALEAALTRGPRLASVENVDKQDVPLESIEGNSFTLK